MGEEVCISEREYQALLNISTEARDIAKTNCTTIEGMEKDLADVKDAVFGNGHVGLRTEIEVVKATMGLKDSHIEAMAEVKLGQKIDWKWVGMILLQAGLLAYVTLS